ncbi:MAG: HD domain-containing protein [Lachnospiraceae bacterium]|nr:HD domain-containing protein [Lachnospiraceae bacterium]
MKLDLTDLICALSFSLDKVEYELLGVETGHGRRVACLCLYMAEHAGISGEELRDYFGCCVLHDNALTEFISEELDNFKHITDESGQQLSEVINVEFVDHNSSHSKIGERNIHLVPFRTNVDNIILYHHEHADGSGPLGKTAAETNLKTQILHLADEIDIHYNLSNLTESEFNKMSEWIESQSGKMFSEKAVRLFHDAVTYDKISYLKNRGAFTSLKRELRTVTSDYSEEEIHSFAGMFARIIDYKSAFTQTHSLGVADKAEQMANYYGFDHEKATRLYLAGALHDIGKLLVSNDILEKAGKLTDDEFSAMKDHASATRYVLRLVKGIPDIVRWAANHHEKLNGKGYPRGLTAEELSFEERLMACVDIYQALTEKRPYKDGFPHEKTIAIMQDMVDKGDIDATIVQDMAVVMADESSR